MLSAVDDASIRDAFGVRQVTFRHDVLDRGELTVSGIAALVDHVPSAWVFAHAAQHDPHEGRGMEPPVGATPLPQVVRDIAHSDASVRVYNLERTREGSELTAAIRERVAAVVGAREGGLHAINLGAFVASPGAVTPAHPDRHHNLLLQIEGRKEIWLDDEADRRRHHLRVLDYLECPTAGVSELPPARSLVLEPGDGVYIPPYMFHWTRLLDEPGVALSIGFSTAATMVGTAAHDFDRRLRRRGAHPRPVAPLSFAGRTKARLERAALARSARRCAGSVTVGAEPGGTQ